MAISSNSISNRKRQRSAAVLAIIVGMALLAPPVSLAQQRISKSKSSSSGGGGSSKSGSFSSGSSSSSATAGGSAFSSGSAGGKSEAVGFGGGSSGGQSGGSDVPSNAGGTVRSKSSKTATASSRAVTDIPADATKTDNLTNEIDVDPRVARPDVQTKRSIAIHDGETLIEISEAPGKIRVRVTKTEDDSEDVTIYAAKNLEDLRKNSPKGYELYEKYMLDDEQEIDAAGQMAEARTRFDDVVSEQQKVMEQHKRQFDEQVRKQREEQNRFIQQFQQNQKNSIKVIP